MIALAAFRAALFFLAIQEKLRVNSTTRQLPHPIPYRFFVELDLWL